MTEATVAELVAASRARQGLAPHVADATALRRVAALLTTSGARDGRLAAAAPPPVSKKKPARVSETPRAGREVRHAADERPPAA